MTMTRIVRGLNQSNFPSMFIGHDVQLGRRGEKEKLKSCGAGDCEGELWCSCSHSTFNLIFRNYVWNI